MRYLLVFTALATASCAVGPDPAVPTFDLPDAFAGSLPETSGGDEAWWTAFGDPALNALVADALSDNLTIGIARARLVEAAAFVRAERSDLLPGVDGQFRAGVREGLEGSDISANSADGGLIFGFVPDLFGGRRRELQAANAEALAAGFDLDDASRLIASQVVGTYLELRRTDARLALLDDSLDLQNRTLEIVRLRAEAGLAADLDVQRALADLAQTRAQRGSLLSSRVGADTLLSVLTARPPSGVLVERLPASTIPSFAEGPDAGVPAALVRRRADLRAAEQDLIAATASIGAEMADLYPSLSLPGSIAADFGADGVASSTIGAITAVLDVPLFDAGRRRSEVRAARARADTALLTYERALLGALREVETALVAIETAKARRDDLAVAVEASERAFDQLQALYTEGLASLIDVLDAQRQLIRSREAFVDAEASLAQSSVDLYTALGAETGRAATDDSASPAG